MNHMYNSLLICFCLIFTGLVSAQSYSVEWFEQNRIEAESAITRYKVGPNNLIYAVSLYPSMIGGFKSEFSFKKFDAELNLLKEIKIDLSEYRRWAKFTAGGFTPEGFAVFGYSYDDEAEELQFFRTVIDLNSMEPIGSFHQIHKISSVTWNSHEPRLYPISTSISPDQRFIIVSLSSSQKIKGTRTNVIFNLEGEIVFDIAPPEEGMTFASIEDGIFMHFMKSSFENQAARHISVNVVTGESKIQDFALQSHLRIISDGLGQVYSFAFDKIDSEVAFEIFCPSEMDSTIKVTIPEDKLGLMADKWQRKSTFWPSQEQNVLDVHKNENGTFVLTLEYSQIFLPKNNHVENIVSICFDSSGTIIWMVCIPKLGYDKTKKRLSALVFRTDEGLHLLYNDGTNNLTKTPDDKRVSYGNNGSGEAIITIATISNDGELTREIFYKSSEDKLWLNLWDSGFASTDMIILSLDYRLNQRFGIIKLD